MNIKLNTKIKFLAQQQSSQLYEIFDINGQSEREEPEYSSLLVSFTVIFSRFTEEHMEWEKPVSQVSPQWASLWELLGLSPKVGPSQGHGKDEPHKQGGHAPQIGSSRHKVSLRLCGLWEDGLAVSCSAYLQRYQWIKPQCTVSHFKTLPRTAFCSPEDQ